MLFSDNKRVIICMGIFLYCFSSPSSGADINGKRGTTAVQILEIIPDARSHSLGGAYTAVGDDAGTVFYNPAGLARISHLEIPLGNNHMFDDMNHSYLGFIYNLHDIKAANVQDPGTLAVTWNSLNTGNITSRDVSGNYLGDFSPESRILTFAYGKTFVDSDRLGRFMAGVSSKFFAEKLYGRRIEGQSYDTGILWKYPQQNIQAGLAVHNIGDKIKYVTDTFSLPMKTTLGVSGKMLQETIMLAADVSKPAYDAYTYNLGVECWYLRTLALRVGYDSSIGLGQGVTAGMGLCVKELDIFFLYAREVTIDYAFIPYSDLGDLHRISLNLKLGAD